MDSPPELLPYLSSNQVLRTYLIQTSTHIAEIDAEIDQLQRALEAEKRQRDHYRKKQKEYSRLQTPARTIPPEIWGVIFGFTLGDKPFGRCEYRMYRYLRQVCTTWRDVVAMTPDLCRGLVIHMDGPMLETSWRLETGIRLPQDKLAPWLAIVSRNHPYHLALSVEDEDDFNWEDDDVAKDVQWILTTEPTPTTLTLINSEMFSLVCANAPRDNQVSHLTLDFPQEVERDILDNTHFQRVNLQSLTLTQILGTPRAFSNFLLDLPALREVRTDSLDPYRHGPENIPNPPPPLVHPTLEILIAGREDLLVLLENLTFPSLQFLGLKVRGSQEAYDSIPKTFPAFIRRCSLDNKRFKASIRGRLSASVLSVLIHNMPCGTRLHLDVVVELDDKEAPHTSTSAQSRLSSSFVEVFCTQGLSNLYRPHEEHDLPPRAELIKMYVPEGLLDRESIETRREELQDWGYALEVLPVNAYRRLLQSMMPKMTIDWEV
ncbi:hypothetical protein BKA70DRAFT_1272405 [Coprinopsis sp. MPI-PUGE-AT-0042]|nr:hypothetical protein BKA70DRAFT_1272405 [Coprinopsis sp. MPI-PUGE-AT-0042]